MQKPNKKNGWIMITLPIISNLSPHLTTEFPTTYLIVRQCDDHILIYKLSDSEVLERNPSIYFTIRILKDLSIKVYINGILIHVSQLHWIIGHTNTALSCWTQLFDIIKRYNVVPVPDIMSKSAFLSDAIKSLGCDLGQEENFHFLAEQLNLFAVPSNRRRFSMETLVLAFILFHKSNACYTELQSTLCLSSKRMLRDI